MVEIKKIWKLMQAKYPRILCSPSSLNKIVHVVNPKDIKAKKTSKGIEITSNLWIQLPRTKPKTTLVTIMVDGLTLDNAIDIDGALLASNNDNAAAEMIKAFFLCDLISLGVFNIPVKREAFIMLTKLPEEKKE